MRLSRPGKIEHRTSNIEHRTSNIEHRTPEGDVMGEEPNHRGTKYDLEDRLLNYAAAVIHLVDGMRPTRAARHVADQLLRSGTSPLGSHGEAQAAESTKDFIHKLKLGLKELRESLRWLKLTHRAKLHEQGDEVARLLDETEQLVRIFVASIHTAQKRLPQQP
jgi:four helix bundle protein